MAYTKAVIGKAVETPTNCFEFSVKFMFGDADNYSSEEWAFFNEEDSLEFANFLKDLLDAPNQRDSLRYNPSEHPSFSKFVIVEEEGMFDENDKYLHEETAQLEYWPNDCDGWGSGKVDGFNVVYTDEHGAKHPVTFK